MIRLVIGSLLAVSAALPTGGGVVLHVSPTGAGDACTAAAPCSLTTAQARTGPHTVELAGGRYRLTEPLRLVAANSGQVWRAAPGEQPVLDGATRVTGWHRHEQDKWVADVPVGSTARQLFVNEVRAVPARGLGCAKSQCTASATGLSGVDPRVGLIHDLKDVRVVLNARWRDFHCGIESVSGTTVTMRQPCWGNANTPTQTGWQSASPTGSAYQGVDWFENAYELLGTPGQFALDSGASKLYYVPRPGEDLATADVELPHTEQLLTVTGASDLTVSGITFADTAWANPEGYVGAQAGYYVNGTRTGTISGAGEDYARTQTAVTVSAGKGVRFSGNRFTRLGGAGIALDKATSNSVVEDNGFTDLSGGAIFVGDVLHSGVKTADNVVRDNAISRIGQEFRDAVGIFGGYNEGLTVDHNTVSQVPYTGISVGWGWNFVGDGDTQHNVLVSHNKVSDFMLTLHDGGAIYTQAQSPGSRVYANDIAFAPGVSANGIYHDERSSYYTTANNVVRDVPQAGTGTNWVSSWASWSAFLIVRDNWTDAPVAAPHNGGKTNQYGPNSMGLKDFPTEAKAVIDQAGAHGARESREVRFTAPTAEQLDGLTDIAVAAPFDTRSVRLSMDGTAFAELTRDYANATGLAPTWSTATDASWFSPGKHVLTATAVTGQGEVTATRSVVTHRPADPPGVTNLNGTWTFGDGTPVLVPDSFGAVRARWNEDNGMVATYRREFTVPGLRPGQHVTLQFDSCYFACQYTVNGQQVGLSTGGNVPTLLDVTAAVHPGSNQITVSADNRVSTIRPYGINTDLYWNWGGLTQGVRMRIGAPDQLSELTATGSADGKLTLHAYTAAAGDTRRAITRSVRVGDYRTSVTFTVPAGSDAADPVTITVPHPHLWTPQDPFLHEVKVGELSTKAGFRTVSVSGSDLLLNGSVLADLRGFNRHADYPGLGRTQPDQLAERELKTMRDKRFTLFRPAHYPTTPGELAAADRLGLLVIEEINVTQANATQLASAKTQDYAKDQLSREIRRDRGHPSVIAWSVGNENATNTEAGAQYVHTLIDHGRALDPSRLFTHVTAWHTSDKAFGYDDFAADNNYDGWYYGKATDIGKDIDAIQAAAGGKPLVLSEYGAEGVKDRPGTGPGTEYYQAQLIDTYNRQLARRPHLIGQMYWTSTEFALTPAGSPYNPSPPLRGYHNKGLRTYDRQDKLAWRVITSPVRMDLLPGNQIQLSNVAGQQVSGTVEVAGGSVTPFTVPPGGASTLAVTGPHGAEVRAVLTAQTEALPVFLP
ncbi:hypothetical protein GCM10010174_27970 [Kutzneria viridogrisea]|uniref:Beta-glucuronidase n=1 Tax=Kutzneria viridogrisea TaxID=47990 RepID=A0ABR6BU49_9PSEU|nr:beta-glucuronidase [Kutzneria viridogrisea]